VLFCETKDAVRGGGGGGSAGGGGQPGRSCRRTFINRPKKLGTASGEERGSLQPPGRTGKRLRDATVTHSRLKLDGKRERQKECEAHEKKVRGTRAE